MDDLFHKYYENKQYDKCREMYDDILNSSDPALMIKMVTKCDSIWNCSEVDSNKMFNLVKKAADLNYGKAHYVLAEMYIRNYWITEYEKSMLKAAELGYRKAFSALGRYYSDKDNQKAKMYFKKAIKAGNIYAMYDLEKLYHEDSNEMEKTIKAVIKYHMKTYGPVKDKVEVKLHELIRGYLILEDRNAELEKENEVLRNQIAYTPGGEGYNEVKTHFENMVDKIEKE